MDTSLYHTLCLLFLTVPGYVLSHDLGHGINCTDVTYWTRMVDKELRGGIKLEVTAHNASACQQFCRIDASCKTFNYNPSAQMCVKISVTSGDDGTVLRDSPGTDYYYQQNICHAESGSVEEVRASSESEEGDDTQEEILQWIIVGMAVVIVLMFITIVVILCAVYPKEQNGWDIKTETTY